MSQYHKFALLTARLDAQCTAQINAWLGQVYCVVACRAGFRAWPHNCCTINCTADDALSADGTAECTAGYSRANFTAASPTTSS